MQCFKCGQKPSEGINLYRQNPKGVPGIFACAAHSRPVDDKLVQIVANLSNPSHNPKKEK